MKLFTPSRKSCDWASVAQRAFDSCTHKKTKLKEQRAIGSRIDGLKMINAEIVCGIPILVSFSEVRIRNHAGSAPQPKGSADHFGCNTSHVPKNWSRLGKTLTPHLEPKDQETVENVLWHKPLIKECNTTIAPNRRQARDNHYTAETCQKKSRCARMSRAFCMCILDRQRR